jgi:transposase
MDVAKAQMDIAVRPAGERWTVPHDTDGVVTLVARLQALHPPRMVLAATGGLERIAPVAVATAGFPVIMVHPWQARDCARATGQWAQTDALEARALAHVAAVLGPPPRPLPDAQTQELRALLGRRPPRIGMRTAAQHRLAGPRERLPQAIEAPMAGLQARITPRDDALETRLRASPLWRANADLVQSVPGIGPGCARTLRLDLPEWGTRTRQHIAAWGGVAPLHGDRGPLRGRRTIGGGRAHGRTGWYMGTLVATRLKPPIKACYQRLRAAGKINKGALTACMQKLLTMLNAMLQHRTSCRAQEVHN